MENTDFIPFIAIVSWVILPIAIVLLRTIAKVFEENKRSQIIIKAIEANKDVNPNQLIETFRKSSRSPRELQNNRLLRGCIFSLIGVLCVIIGLYFHLTGTLGANALVSFITAGVSLSIGISYLIVYFVMRQESDETK
jgi:hypothetical protein